MKKISELTEYSGSGDILVPATYNNETIKYNLGNLDSKVDNSNSSIGSFSDFNIDTNYYTGNIVRREGKLYKFVKTHLKGVWNELDVTETSIFNEISGEGLEKVIVRISFSDGVSAAGRQAYIITTNNSGEIVTDTLTADSNGLCSPKNISKGKIYSVRANDEDGYTLNTIDSIEASKNTRYLDLIYNRNNQTCSLEINIVISGNGQTSDFEGQSFYIKQGTTQMGANISNLKATFTGLKKNTNYTILNSYLGHSGTYKHPENFDIVLGLNNNVLNLEYSNLGGEIYGLYAVKDDGTEEYIDQEFIDTLDSGDKNTYIAIHVIPETLAKNGYDYYVRCKDLTSERTITTKTWGTYGKTLPNVSTNTSTEYRGQLMTYYMIKDERTVSPVSKSNAAEYATSQSLTINNKTAYGYIGTKAQLDFILPASYSANKTLIYNFLTAIGYATPNYSSTFLWSSSQYNANYAWLWFSGGYWNTNNKYNAYLVVPLFSFSSL